MIGGENSRHNNELSNDSPLSSLRTACYQLMFHRKDNINCTAISS